MAEVTDPSQANFVPIAERIATFDNDGCLWAEQPIYFQLAYTFDQVKRQVSQHPDWKTTPPFSHILDGQADKALAEGHEGLFALLAATHGGLSAAAFSQQVRHWFATARHPQTQLRYDQMVYQPMLELLEFLRGNDFKTFIVSGGGFDFIWAYAEAAYGIPPEQVIGSSLQAR